MGDLIPLTPKGRTSPNERCSACGSEWFDPKGVVIAKSGEVVGMAYPVRCHDCGLELGL